MGWPPTLTLPSVMESGVVGGAGVCAAGVAGAAGFSSGFSCAGTAVEAVNTAASVNRAYGAGQLRQATTIHSTSRVWDVPEYNVRVCGCRIFRLEEAFAEVDSVLGPGFEAAEHLGPAHAVAVGAVET